jgi:hypothetical protein
VLWLAGERKLGFHVMGLIPLLIGAAGAFLSLFWDVIYRGKAFSPANVGPFKLAGLAAGIALAVAGLVAGFVLGRRARSRAGLGAMPSMSQAYKILGVLLIIGGLGGTFVSLLWDVVRRGKAFSAASIGPMKLMGIGAGIVLTAVGIVMVFWLARRKQQAPSPATAAAALAPQAGAHQAQEEIPFALPVEQAQAPPEGAVPPEAIPVEEP